MSDAAVAGGRIHIVGAGLAGLSAAVTASGKGAAVTLSEMAAQAGGRCRSYFDTQLGLTIDNGNHLVLSGNRAVNDYLAAIGASASLSEPRETAFPFHDLRDGARWTVRPNDGPIPWWIFDPARRVPGSTIAQYIDLARLFRGPDRRIGDVVATSGAFWRKLVEPLLLAALNTPPEEGSTRLAANVLRESMARGGRWYRPRIALPNLAAAFVDPALDLLARRHATVHLGRRLLAIEWSETRATALIYKDEVVALADGDSVILSVPPWAAAALVPDLIVPDEHHAIMSLHYAIEPPATAPTMIGVLGGTTEWIFSLSDRISVTISAADRLNDVDRERIAREIWAEVSQVYGLTCPIPPWQIVREKRATFAATPAQQRRRPSSVTRWNNFFLAGDWTDTGLPATIEASIRSGQTAAHLAIAAAPL